MGADGSGDESLGRARAGLTAAARACRDRRWQRELIDLAAACVAYGRAPDPARLDALAARVRTLTGTARLVGEDAAVAALGELADTLAVLAGGSPMPVPLGPGNGAVPVPAAARAVARPAPPAADGPLVLVVDDDPGTQRALAAVLGAEGFRVAVADAGGPVLTRALAARPALVICDLHMPLVPGELLILALRTDPVTAAIPIVVLSATPERLGPEHRVDAVLTKPADARVLAATVRRLVAATAGAGAGAGR